MRNPSSGNDDDQFVAQIVAESPDLPSFSGSEPERFFTEIHSLLERRAQDDWSQEPVGEMSAVFVMVDFPRKPLTSTEFNLARVIDLPVTKEQVFGRIFFLSFNAGNGTSMALPVESNDILDWLSNNNLGHCPVAIAYRDTQKLSSRPSAEHDSVAWKTIRDKKPELDISSIKDALSAFHTDQLTTPTSCGPGIWEAGRSGEYIPATNTEKAIQLRLKVHLAGWFRGIVRVGIEDTIDNGRIDVRLLTPPQSGQGLQYWSIIELKVARSFRNAPKGKKAGIVGAKSLIDEVLKGIAQAHEFTATQEVKEGFLEIYDMRKDKSQNLLLESQVKAKLKKCSVAVNANLRPMFGSAEEARDYSFAAS